MGIFWFDMVNDSASCQAASQSIMIVAGEASGDLHGANLVKAIKARTDQFAFFGMGGTALKKAGVELIYDAAKLSVVGLFEVFSHLKDIRRARNMLIHRMQQERPRVLILIDFPDFNLSLAKKARSLNLPVFYYISPQVWAWRSGRVRTIAKLVDKMAVILPFEKAFYQEHGMEVDFVGHPLLDHVKCSTPAQLFRKQHGIADTSKVIGILPGSRMKEIQKILPVFLETAKNITSHRSEDIIFLLALAPSLKKEDLHCAELFAELPNIRIIDEDRYDLMAACDIVMAASGTVTLELAILHIPMVVAYKISPITYFVGRRLIKVQHASLVNLVVQEEIVEEYLQKDCTPHNLEAALIRIWPGSEKHTAMKNKLREVGEILGNSGASGRTAQLVLELINNKDTST
jgi:lipid-A-disaccharide synthase